jgi:hypothetical protein
MFNIHQFDFISPNITLYYRSNLKHSSIPSVIISIFSIIILLVLSVIFSLDFIMHKNPSAYYYHEYVEDAGIYPLNSSQMFHFITIGEAIPSFSFDPRAISLIGVSVTDDIILANNNESEYDHWIYDFCEGEKDALDKMIYLSEFKNRFEQKGLCVKKFYDSKTKKIINSDDINFQYPILAHGNSNPNEVLYGVFMQRCQNNSILNNYTCYDSDKIDSLIKLAVEYSIYFIEQNIYVNNYNNPFNHFFYRLTNHFNSESYTINHLNFHPTLMKTHSGFIFDHVNYKYTYTYFANEKFVVTRNEENKNTNIYAMYYFWMQNLQDTYERKYKMLQDITGSIGGIIKIVMIIAQIFNYIFNEFAIINDLNSDILFKYKRLSNKFESNQNLKLFSNNIKNSFTLNNSNKNKYGTIDNSESQNYNISNNNENNKKIKNNNYIRADSYQLKSNISKSNHTFNRLINSNNFFLEKLNNKKGIKRKNSEINYNFIFNVNKDLYNDNLSPYNGFKKITYSDVFLYKLCKKSRNNFEIENLIKFRKVLISEEALFSSYYLQKSFEKLLIYLPNENIDINKVLKNYKK